jgi:hypothetical protein
MSKSSGKSARFSAYGWALALNWGASKSTNPEANCLNNEPSTCLRTDFEQYMRMAFAAQDKEKSCVSVLTARTIIQLLPVHDMWYSPCGLEGWLGMSFEIDWKCPLCVSESETV